MACVRIVENLSRYISFTMFVSVTSENYLHITFDAIDMDHRNIFCFCQIGSMFCSLLQDKDESTASTIPKKTFVRPGHVSRADDLLVTRDKARKLGDANAESIFSVIIVRSVGNFKLLIDLLQ